MDFTELNDIYKRYKLSGIFLNGFCKVCRIFGVSLYFGTLYGRSLDCNLREDSREDAFFKKLHYQDFISQKKINDKWFTDKKLNEIKQAFEIEGNIAYGHFEDNLLICYGWISLKYIQPNKLELMSQDGYIWDDYTHPDFRGKGIHRRISDYRCLQLLKAGKKRALTIVASYNAASRKGFKRIGFKKIKSFINYSYGRYNPIRSNFKYSDAVELIILDNNHCQK